MSNNESPEAAFVAGEVEAVVAVAESTVPSPKREPGAVVKNSWVAFGPGEVDGPAEEAGEGAQAGVGVVNAARQSSEVVIIDVAAIGDDGRDSAVATVVDAVVVEEAAALSSEEVAAVSDEQVLAALAAVGVTGSSSPVANAGVGEVVPAGVDGVVAVSPSKVASPIDVDAEAVDANVVAEAVDADVVVIVPPTAVAEAVDDDVGVIVPPTAVAPPWAAASFDPTYGLLGDPDAIAAITSQILGEQQKAFVSSTVWAPGELSLMMFVHGARASRGTSGSPTTPPSGPS
jgi:hypothetical protein